MIYFGIYFTGTTILTAVTGTIRAIYITIPGFMTPGTARIITVHTIMAHIITVHPTIIIPGTIITGMVHIIQATVSTYMALRLQVRESPVLLLTVWSTAGGTAI